MHRLIALVILILVLGAGIFVWQYEGRATKDSMNFKVVQWPNGAGANLSWSQPTGSDILIEIFQSQDENQAGEKIGQVALTDPQSFQVKDLVVNQRYFFTLKTSNGDFLSRQSVITENYPSDIVLTGKNEQGIPVVKIFNPEGEGLKEFAPLGLSYRGEIGVVRLDLDADGVEELLVYPKQSYSKIKLFSSSGTLISELAPYGEKFNRGFSTVALNLDKTSGVKNYLAVAARWASGNGKKESYPVKLFKIERGKFTLKDEFVEYDNFNGGVELFSGDANGDGRDELYTTPISGAAEVRVHQFCQNDLGDCQKFYGLDKLTKPFSVYDKLFPYGKMEKQDLGLELYDLNGDGDEEVIIYPLSGRMSLVKIYTCQLSENYRCLFTELDSFQAYQDKFKGGVSVKGITFDDTRNLVVGPLAGGGPHLKIYRFENGALNLLAESFVYGKEFLGGVSLLPLNRDGDNELVTSPLSKGGSHIKILNPAKLSQIKEFFAFEKSLRGAFCLY